MASFMTERDQVFISYCRHDKEWLERLQTYLSRWWARIAQCLGRHADPGRAGVAGGDRPGVGPAGRRVAGQPDFLASDFIADVELPAILRAAQRGGLQVIWIPIRASLFAETELGKYQAAWDPARTLAELKPAARDKAFVEIAKTSMMPPREGPAMRGWTSTTRLSGGQGSWTATRF